MRGIGRTLLVALLLSAVADINLRADTIAAASCSAIDVQAALNRADDGDTVTIPGGTCSWTTQVTWTAPPNVILRGAGNTSVGGGDVTVIVDNYANSQPVLGITTNASGTFRMSGITIRGGSVGTSKDHGILFIGGQSKQFRLDHVHIDISSYVPANNGRAIRFYGWIYGVIDHSIFDANQAFDVWYDGYGNSGDGDRAWADPTGLGTNAFIFAEDNVFNALSKYGAANDCSHGGKWVVRHNTMNLASVQTHPTGGAGRGRGCRAWELYNNRFIGSTTDPNFNAFFLSSGTGVIWNNTVSGFSNFVTLHSMRKSNGTYPQYPTPDGWGYCGTEFNGRGSNWDGNTNATTGYPCLDQPGRGRGDLLSGGFPNVTNTATGCSSGSPCAWPRQALEPIYDWGNVWTPVPGWGGNYYSNQQGTVLAQNRDYYLQASPFTGAAGTGVGNLAERPSTCSIGVAYWASDTSTLFQCSATNTWTVYYRPFTYPHPLTQTSGGGVPSAPRNLHIVP